jgi:hypothetical protein
MEVGGGFLGMRGVRLIKGGEWRGGAGEEEWEVGRDGRGGWESRGRALD